MMTFMLVIVINRKNIERLKCQQQVNNKFLTNHQVDWNLYHKKLICN